MSRRIGFGCSVRLDEISHQNRAENPPYLVVYDRYGNLAVVHRIHQRLPHEIVRAASGHFDIKASKGWADCVVCCAPIRHDRSLEAPVSLYDLILEVSICGAVGSLESVICRHYGKHFPFRNSGLEGGKIDFLQRPLADLRVDRSPFDFLAVGGKVLDARGDTLALHPLYIGNCQAACEKRILAHVLESPSA